MPAARSVRNDVPVPLGEVTDMMEDQDGVADIVNFTELSDDGREMWVPNPLPDDVVEAAKAYLDNGWTELHVVGGRLVITLGPSSGVTAVRMHVDLLHGLADMDLDVCASGPGSTVTVFYRHPGAGQWVSETRLRMTVGRDVELPDDETRSGRRRRKKRGRGAERCRWRRRVLGDGAWVALPPTGGWWRKGSQDLTAMPSRFERTDGGVARRRCADRGEGVGGATGGARSAR